MCHPNTHFYVRINLQVPFFSLFFLFSINMENVCSAVYNPDASGSSQISILPMIHKLSFPLSLKELLPHQKQKLVNDSSSPHCNLFFRWSNGIYLPISTHKKKKVRKYKMYKRISSGCLPVRTSTLGA